MKKFLLIAAVALWTAFSVAAQYKTGYYDRMEGQRREALKKAAKACVITHTRLNYTNLPNYWQYSDVYPELYNGCKRWWEMYSNEVYLIRSGENARGSFSRNGMQREHSVPKSWWKRNGDVEYTPAYSDMWNLYPSDGAANQKKLNYPLGVCSRNPAYDNGSCKVGGPVTGFGGGAGAVFEPADEYKGDFARGYFYMATVYDDINWVINYMFRAEAYPTLTPWAYNMLLDWHRRDPVSQKEIDRNNAVEKSQGNRNPFVDFPELAEYIWGTRTAETFYIKDQTGQQTAPITGPAMLSKPVSGEALDFTRTSVGHPVTAYLQLEGKNFTQAISLRISGPGKDLFTLSTSSIRPSEINPKVGSELGTYLLPIVYNPVAPGSSEATLAIYDGGLASSIAVTLRGEAAEVPMLSTPVATDPSDLTDTSYIANWKAAPVEEAVEYYVLTRVRYLQDGPDAETYQSDTNSLLLTDRDPAVMESYSVQSYALGVLSEPSNSIVVATNGIVGVDDELPLVLGNIDGGFSVISNPAGEDLTVVDMTGKTVMISQSPEEGSRILLAPGCYVVISQSRNTKPVKILVE